ncbi:hypothetical protein M407DRAFT_20059 [Tulasnella calospora MUT 4182]|uniref:Uncharacterized protein n=1 Tax=Tulasnella calospora MUT 4182 TaxID=1051891 RepID=A0A0C3QGV3_9AGAM|nr:hypothetical protein M407DRAFT_20059 [Tulasnella calospora MUT 4182]
MSTMKASAVQSFTLFYTDLEAPQDWCQPEQNQSSQQLRPDEVEMLLKECDDMLIESEGMAPSQT